MAYLSSERFLLALDNLRVIPRDTVDRDQIPAADILRKWGAQGADVVLIRPTITMSRSEFGVLSVKESLIWLNVEPRRIGDFIARKSNGA